MGTGEPEKYKLCRIAFLSSFLGKIRSNDVVGPTVCCNDGLYVALGHAWPMSL